MDNLLRDDVEERQERLERMIAEYEKGRRRRLVEYGVKLWDRTEAALRRGVTSSPAEPPLTIN